MDKETLTDGVSVITSRQAEVRGGFGFFGGEGWLTCKILPVSKNKLLCLLRDELRDPLTQKHHVHHVGQSVQTFDSHAHTHYSLFFFPFVPVMVSDTVTVFKKSPPIQKHYHYQTVWPHVVHGGQTSGCSQQEVGLNVVKWRKSKHHQLPLIPFFFFFLNIYRSGNEWDSGICLWVCTRINVSHVLHCPVHLLCN